MAENVIQAVGSAESDNRISVMYQMAQNQLYRVANTIPAEKAEKAEKVEKPASSEKGEKAEEKPAQSLLPVTNGDTFLRFMVDEKSNDITVYVVDRASRRVMRSIPPSEVNNLKAGDLLKLLA